MKQKQLDEAKEKTIAAIRRKIGVLRLMASGNDIGYFYLDQAARLERLVEELQAGVQEKLL